MLLESLDIGPAEFAAGTGWEIKPQGACKGEVCVPLGEAGRDAGDDAGDDADDDADDGTDLAFDVRAVADRLGMALVLDDASGLWALGPESLGDRALATAEAPELVLDDIGGNEFRLSSLRGRKVVIVSWAPY